MHFTRFFSIVFLLAFAVCAQSYTVGGMNRPTFGTAPQGNVRPGTQSSGSVRPTTQSTGEVHPTTQPGNSPGIIPSLPVRFARPLRRASALNVLPNPPARYAPGWTVPPALCRKPLV